DHHGALHAAEGEGLGHEWRKVQRANASELSAGASRVGEGAEHVEHGPDAEFAARTGDMLHRGVELLREEKCEPAGIDRLRGPRPIEIEARAESFEHVGAAAAR